MQKRLPMLLKPARIFAGILFLQLFFQASVSGQTTTTTTTCSVTADAGPDVLLCPGASAVLNGSCSASSTTTTSTVAASSSSVYATAVPTTHGWTFSDARWSRVTTNLAGGAAGEFRFQYSSTATSTFTATSPLITATGFSGMTMSFKHFLDNFNASSYPYTLSVQTSVDGTTWTNRWSIAPTGTANIAATTVSGIDLSALSGTSFYVRFNFTGNTFGLDYWYVDDIAITGFATTTSSTTTALTPSYSWSPVGSMTSGSTTLTPTVAPTATTNYVLTVNAATCSKTDTAVVTLVQMTANAGPDFGLCSGSSAPVAGASTTSPAAVVATTATQVYNTSVPTTHGWTFSDTRWSRVATNLAGGAAGELRFYSSASTNTTYTATSPLITASSFSGMTLSFKHYVNNYSATSYPYTLSVETSTDGTTWTTRWSNSPTASIAATTVSGISLSGLNGTSFYIRLNFTGQEFGIYGWYVDDIAISGYSTVFINTSYAWTPSATITSGAATVTPTVAPTATTSYILTATAAGCTAKDTVKVTVLGANAGADQSICRGNALSLSGSVTTPTILVPATSSTTSTVSGQPYNTSVPVSHGWTFSDARWSRVTTNLAGGGAGEFRFYYSASATGTYTATSPAIAATGYTGLTLAFRHYLSNFNGASYPYTLSVQTSTDGTNWITRWSTSPTASIAATTVSGVDLSALNGTTFYLRLNFTGQESGIFGWYVDDIVVSGTTTVTTTSTVYAPTPVTYSWSPAGSITGGAATLTPTVAPTATTTYVLTATAGSCSANDDVTVTLPTASGNLAVSGETATCVVKAGETVHFFQPSTGNYIATVTAGATDLGSTSATAYVDPILDFVPDCSAPAIETAVLQRHWVINPATQGTASVRLPYSQAELNALIPASVVSTSLTDDLSDQSGLKLSKYSGPNVDADPDNNCPSAGGSGSPMIISQASSGLTPVSGIVSLYSDFSIPGFSEFWLHGSNGPLPLPVALTSFTVTCNDHSQLVEWETASENTCDHYELERSRDGVSWEAAATIAGNGTTQQAHHYASEQALTGELVYFRLRQLTTSGTEEVFGPLTADCSDGSNALTAFPNPSAHAFTVSVTSSSRYPEAQLTVTGLNGQTLAARTIDISEGTTHLFFDDLKLAPGTYVIAVAGQQHAFIPIRMVIL